LQPTRGGVACRPKRGGHMRIIEQMTPCHCENCRGKEQLTRMEIIADTAEDARALTEIAARLRAEARAAGKPVTERHINVNIRPQIPPEKKAKAEAARNN